MWKEFIFILTVELCILLESLTRAESTCSDSSCYNLTNSGSPLQPSVVYDEAENVSDSYDEYSDFDTTMPEPMHIVSSNQSFVKNRYSGIQKTKADVCQCDLTVNHYEISFMNHDVKILQVCSWSDFQVALCDINCCCDKDCNEFHLSVFSLCKQNEIKNYDNRYCYKQNLIVSDNTPYIHKKIVDNLFCIVHDNLPPTYNPRDHVSSNQSGILTLIKTI